MRIDKRKLLCLILTICMLFGLSAQTQAATGKYSLENKKAASYIKNVKYDKNYTYSKVYNYITTWEDRYDRPEGVKITFPKQKKKVTVILSLKSNLKKPCVNQKVKGTVGSVKIYNLIPQQTYYYAVKSATGKKIASGKFKTTGRLRMCYVDKVFNVRDIGGWKTVDGERIVYGRIYRGGEMDGNTKISSQGKTTMLKTLGIKCDLDLRNDSELKIGTKKAITKSPLGSSVQYCRYSIDAYDIRPIFADRYRGILRTIFDCVEQDKPVYIHCMGGADRTGTVSYLIEGLLGVSESDLIKDYELTSFYLERPRTYAQSKYRTFPKLVEQIKVLEGENYQEQFESYFLNLGFSYDEIAAFRDKMLE